MLQFDPEIIEFEVDYEAHMGNRFSNGGHAAGTHHELLKTERDPRWSGKETIRARLGYFKRDHREPSILRQIREAGFRHAVPPELAEVGIKFSRLQESKSIIAAGAYGQFGMTAKGSYIVAKLSCGEDGRSADIERGPVLWGAGFRFLLVPIVA